MKIIVALDKFKGTATAEQACHAVARALEQLYPRAKIMELPIADGGDGTMQALWHSIGESSVRVSDNYRHPINAHERVQAEFFYTAKNKTAFMDLASTSGLVLCPQPDALQASTIGTGQMIRHALAIGCRNIILGLGGSATTDGGMGVLGALGCKFYDSMGHELSPCGAVMAKVEHIDTRNLMPEVRQAHYTLLTDVGNPLVGQTGAALLFSRQKGASEEQSVLLEKGLQHLAKLTQSNGNIPGMGAAGGVPLLMTAILSATLRMGADWILDLLNFSDHLRDADLVITGEGRIDEQTQLGKGPYCVAQRALKAKIPCIAVCGQLARGVGTAPYTAIYPINPEGPVTDTTKDTDTKIHSTILRVIPQHLPLKL